MHSMTDRTTAIQHRYYSPMWGEVVEFWVVSHPAMSASADDLIWTLVGQFQLDPTMPQVPHMLFPDLPNHTLMRRMSIAPADGYNIETSYITFQQLEERLNEYSM